MSTIDPNTTNTNACSARILPCCAHRLSQVWWGTHPAPTSWMVQPGASVHPNLSRLSNPLSPSPLFSSAPAGQAAHCSSSAHGCFKWLWLGSQSPGSHTAGQTLQARGAPGTERVRMGWIVRLERPQEDQEGLCTVVCRTGGTRGEHQGPCMVVCRTRKTTGGWWGACVAVRSRRESWENTRVHA